MDLREIGWDGVYWIHLTEFRDQWEAVVNMVIKTLGSIKGKFLR